MRSHCILCVCQSGKLLLTVATSIILGSESHKTHDHILLSHNSVVQQLCVSACVSVSFLHNFAVDWIENIPPPVGYVIFCVVHIMPNESGW
jgi:hypothetical protein